ELSVAHHDEHESQSVVAHCWWMQELTVLTALVMVTALMEPPMELVIDRTPVMGFDLAASGARSRIQSRVIRQPTATYAT
ncbi:hypothetical protein, partial [Chloroflexus sp.]|uniref:hypothetical protein n=1 Tax=Chloroflexus sp. TaxID=1904827 RepID=UPI0025802412